MLGAEAWARFDRRLGEAFRDEERRGLMLAIEVRSAIVLVIFVWSALNTVSFGLAHVFVLAVILLFGALGLVQHWVLRVRRNQTGLVYIFPLVDCALLAVLLCFRNPLLDHQVPPGLILRGSEFGFFLVFLLQAAFSFRPKLVVWTGACILASWTAVLAWVLGQPETTWGYGHTDVGGFVVFLARLSDPDYVMLGKWAGEVVVGAVLTGGLAVLVARSRRLVATRSVAERARANLARYFSPKVVDRLAAMDRPLGSVRRQDVAVLFADIVGFTALSERLAPEETMALLRGFHQRMEAQVFAHDGTLDKYIGDCVMATFGVPDSSGRDAANALACALAMRAALAAWNRERAAAGEATVRMGIGLHYGPVVLGDTGSERSLAFTVIGDTVNAASRLEALTRQLGAELLVGDAVVQRIREEVGDAGFPELDSLVPAGQHHLRGRQEPIAVWRSRERGISAEDAQQVAHA